MSVSDHIWDREGVDRLDKSTYIRAVAGFTLVVGLVVAAGVRVSYNWELGWPLLIGTFVAAIVGILVFSISDNPVVSGLGVTGMSLTLGLMIGPMVAQYESGVVLLAVVTTAAVMVVMSVIGILFPKVFEGWGPYLLAGLTLLILAQFAQVLFVALGFPEAADMTIITWVGIGLFTVIVAFDWSRALSLPKTWDNAIDASGGLILDAVNLFIRFLQIYGGSRSSSSNR